MKLKTIFNTVNKTQATYINGLKIRFKNSDVYLDVNTWGEDGDAEVTYIDYKGNYKEITTLKDLKWIIENNELIGSERQRMSESMGLVYNKNNIGV